MRKVLNTPLVSHEMHRYLSDPHHSHSFGLFCSLSLSVSKRSTKIFVDNRCGFVSLGPRPNELKCERNKYICTHRLVMCALLQYSSWVLRHTHTHTFWADSNVPVDLDWMNVLHMLRFFCAPVTLSQIIYTECNRHAYPFQRYLRNLFFASLLVCMCLDTHWKHSDEFMNRSHNNHQMFETSMHRFNVEESLNISFTAAIFFGPNYISYTLLLRREWWAIQSSMGIDVMKTVLMLSIFHFKFTHK